MSAAEKLEVIPTKTGFIIRLIVYLFLFFPLFIVWVWIGTEEIKKSETGLGSEIAAWFFMLVLLFVLLILDFIENIWGYFHRKLVLTETKCYYINSFGKKRKFKLDEVSYSLRYIGKNCRLILRDGDGKVIARLICDYSLKNVEKIRPFIEEHRK